MQRVTSMHRVAKQLGIVLGILAISSVACPSPAVASERGAAWAPATNWAPVGKWRGEWISGTNGHRGPLRASIRQTAAGDYRAVFAGRFAKVIPFVYSTRLTPTPWPGQYTSVKRLPLVGTYRMSATVTPGHFEATFQGRKDQGVFRLDRR
ncbi:hypothetical protein SH139x_000488 [Planctomycetaceae bacterium SH139]